MADLETVRITFTCSHCGAINELTAAYVHEGTVIHCSRCRASIAPLGLLLHRHPQPQHPAELLKA
jgi:DNA-directed RNA polymerase subunit RPC12/RpoP